MKQMFNARDLAVAQGVAAALLFLSIPCFTWLGLGTRQTIGALHGLASMLTVIVSAFLLHLTYPLLRGREEAAKRLIGPLWITNLLTLLSVIFGNWLYIGYRAHDGVQQWYLANAPAAHTVVMEYKEFVSLFPLPLGLAAAFLLWRYREDLHGSGVAHVVTMLITLLWICLLIGLATGLGLAKLKLV